MPHCVDLDLSLGTVDLTPDDLDLTPDDLDLTPGEGLTLDLDGLWRELDEAIKAEPPSVTADRSLEAPQFPGGSCGNLTLPR